MCVCVYRGQTSGKRVFEAPKPGALSRITSNAIVFRDSNSFLYKHLAVSQCMCVWGGEGKQFGGEWRREEELGGREEEKEGSHKGVNVVEELYRLQ